jgi:hypothetical protein
MTVREQAAKLLQATQELVAYIENNQVYDKLSDCGCGLYDTYRTDAFEAAIAAAKAAVQELRAALEGGG